MSTATPLPEPAIEIIALTGSADTAEQAIRLCGEALQAAGAVGPQFAQGCIEREQEFPTGLIAEVPVAIPHCRSDDIYRDAVCYLRLDSPVTFRRMDDEDETVRTRSLLNIAIGSGGDHVDFLARTMRLVMNAEVMRELQAMDIARASDFLNDWLQVKE